MRSHLKQIFSQVLKLKLVELGFVRVRLQSCIHYEEMWRKGRLWFGVSIDWREQHLEISLGHLYWFRDVMPHVIILGDYSRYVDFDPLKLFKTDGLTKSLEAVCGTLENALDIYRDRYPDILHTYRQPKKSKYAKEFLLALRDEVKEEELNDYYAEPAKKKSAIKSK